VEIGSKLNPVLYLHVQSLFPQKNPGELNKFSWFFDDISHSLTGIEFEGGSNRKWH